MSGTLIIVYNMDSDIITSITDTITRLITPEKCECNLCLLTHGSITVHEDWKKFLKQSGYEAAFYYKDEFKSAYPELVNQELPTVLLAKDNNINVILSPHEIDKLKSLEELKHAVQSKLKSNKL